MSNLLLSDEKISYSVLKIKQFKDSPVSAVSISAVFNLVRFTNHTKTALNSAISPYSAVFFKKTSQKTFFSNKFPNKIFFVFVFLNFEAKNQYLTQI